jgi:opacity protein-like surface antigen
VRATIGKCIVMTTALLLACPMFAQAQWNPTNEVFLGGSYVRTDDNPHVNAFGWETSYSQYPYSSPGWLGGTIEAGGVYASPIVRIANQTVGGLLNNQLYTFMGGPAIALHSHRRLQPFAHVLFGAVLTRVNTTGKGLAYFGTAVSESKTAFGLAPGGGIDVPLTAKIAVRGQADWLRSTFQDQNILRVSLGMVVKF